MGESELKIALRREGEERVRQFWQEAEASVAAKRDEIEEQLSQLRAQMARRLEAETTEMANNMLFNAQSKSRKRQLLAEAEIEQRLLALGEKMLPELGGISQGETWQALCAEIPRAEWTVIIVAPEDEELAKSSFPQARIECDAKIGRGLVAENNDGSIRIDNSLRCRMLRAWPDLLPGLMMALRKQVEDNETS